MKQVPDELKSLMKKLGVQVIPCDFDEVAQMSEFLKNAVDVFKFNHALMKPLMDICNKLKSLSDKENQGRFTPDELYNIAGLHARLTVHFLLIQSLESDLIESLIAPSGINNHYEKEQASKGGLQ